MTVGLGRNNPWDLLPEHVPWLGLTPDQPDSGPLQFDTMADGIRAGIRLCYTYQRRGWDSPLTFITEFAPASAGNPTATYITNVCKWTGFKFDQTLNFHDQAVLVPWAHAIFRQEHGWFADVISDLEIIQAKGLADEP